MRIAAKSAVAALAVAGALAGCTSYRYEGTAAAPAAAPARTVALTGNPVVYTPTTSPGSTILTPATTTFRAGNGTVESIALVHIVPAGQPNTSASAGATVPGQTAYRVTVRMDDGGFQAVDQDNRDFRVGDRVSFAADGTVARQ